MVVGAYSSKMRAHSARRMQRLHVCGAGVIALVMTVAGLAFEPNGGRAVSAAATTSSVIPGPVVPLAQFPVQGRCTFTDTYGAPRSGGRVHEGVDLIAKSGQYVYAVEDGVLTKQFLDSPGSLSGNGWRLTMPDGTYFFYAHLSGFAAGLTVGTKVLTGQIIGYVGMTGDAGTPHLHFEIHPGGGASINPTPSVKAIDACNVTAVPAVGGNPNNATTPTDPSTTQVTTPATNPGSSSPTTTVAPSESPATDRWQFIEPVVVYNGASLSSVAAGVTKKIKVVGTAGISTTTGGVLVRVSSSVSKAGSVVVHACSDAAPIATTLFVEPGAMAIGVTQVTLVDGALCLTTNTAASVKITVIGQLAPVGVGLFPVSARALDTRDSGRLAVNVPVTITPAAYHATGNTKAVTATITIVNPAGGGTLSIGPCGGTPLKAPFPKMAYWAFTAVLMTSSTGLCASSTVAVDVVVDVDGLWTGEGQMVQPAQPLREFDSRTTGAPVGATPIRVALGGWDGGPSVIATAVVDVTILGGAGGGSVFVWSCEKAQPAAAFGVVGPNKRGTFAITTATTNGTICIAANHPVDVIIDISGAG